MSRAVRLVAWALVFVALGATAASWVVLARDRPELAADDAADVAVGVMTELGFDATVEGSPTLMEHTPESGVPLPAWSVLVDADGNEVELRVQQDAGQVVYVDDNIGQGERLLTDEEFESIGAYRDDAVIDQARQENAAATVSTALIAVAGTTIARRSRRIWS